ncbi:MAG: branched-chain amino acid ABC transporter substrate-binding protein, partial [Candidatus Sedimenticola sp. (ex Thyasira tokunagai)]
TEYRAEDHQAFKDVLVVRGNQNPSSSFDVLKVEQVVPRAQVEYDAKIFGGELGPYKV